QPPGGHRAVRPRRAPLPAVRPPRRGAGAVAGRRPASGRDRRPLPPPDAPPRAGRQAPLLPPPGPLPGLRGPAPRRGPRPALSPAPAGPRPAGGSARPPPPRRHRDLPVQDFIARLARELFGSESVPDDLTLLGLERCE